MTKYTLDKAKIISIIDEVIDKFKILHPNWQAYKCKQGGVINIDITNIRKATLEAVDFYDKKLQIAESNNSSIVSEINKFLKDSDDFIDTGIVNDQYIDNVLVGMLEKAYLSEALKQIKKFKNSTFAPARLVDCFPKESNYRKAISLLQNVSPPVIDMSKNYLWGPRKKTVISDWLNFIEKHTSYSFRRPDTILLAELVNNEFCGLNISPISNTLSKSNRKYLSMFKSV